MPSANSLRPSSSDSAEGLCLRCGLRGRHVSWGDCIGALRDRIVTLEIEVVKLRTAKHAWSRVSGDPVE